MTDLIESDFDKFWACYPRRKDTPTITGKAKCKIRFFDIIEKIMPEIIIEGARQYAGCDKVAEGYICMPITWLNQERWDDEYDLDPETQRHRDVQAARAVRWEMREPADWQLTHGGWRPELALWYWNEALDGPRPRDAEHVKQILREGRFNDG